MLDIKDLMMAWGEGSRQWNLWSAWDDHYNHLLQSVTYGRLTKSKEDFVDLINDRCDSNRLSDLGWSPIGFSNFVVLRVNKDKPKYYEQTHQVEIFTNQIIFHKDKCFESFGKREKYPVRVFACGGLAEVLNSILDVNDVLVITGGYEVLKGKEYSGNVAIGLNYTGKEETRIMRLTYNEEEMVMYENIVPLRQARMYKFTYYVQWEQKDGQISHRTVTRHCSFSMECPKISDTLLLGIKRRNFPVPIVKYANPCQWYKLLACNEYSLFAEKQSERFQKQKENYLMRKVRFQDEKEDLKLRKYGKPRKTSFTSTGYGCTLLVWLTVLMALFFMFVVIAVSTKILFCDD